MFRSFSSPSAHSSTARMFGLRPCNSLLISAILVAYSASTFWVSWTLVRAACSWRASGNAPKSTRKVQIASNSWKLMLSRSLSRNKMRSTDASSFLLASGISTPRSLQSRKMPHFMQSNTLTFSLSFFKPFLASSAWAFNFCNSERLVFTSFSVASFRSLRSFNCVVLASRSFDLLAPSSSNLACLSLLDSISRRYCSMSRRRASNFELPCNLCCTSISSACKPRTLSSCCSTSSFKRRRKRCSF
mmetsp:Transcript_123088/g.307394  ORF Transcript_123088/g.307394 Transcript_123088/m.307394 type:complete len:245 (+) Transcript_123088:142-876(+)